MSLGSQVALATIVRESHLNRVGRRNWERQSSAPQGLRPKIRWLHRGSLDGRVFQDGGPGLAGICRGFDLILDLGIGWIAGGHLGSHPKFLDALFARGGQLQGQLWRVKGPSDHPRLCLGQIRSETHDTATADFVTDRCAVLLETGKGGGIGLADGLNDQPTIFEFRDGGAKLQMVLAVAFDLICEIHAI